MIWLLCCHCSGVGKDGHIGSLYPHREEVLVDDQLVLSVDKVNTIYFSTSLQCSTVTIAACMLQRTTLPLSLIKTLIHSLTSCPRDVMM